MNWDEATKSLVQQLALETLHPDPTAIGLQKALPGSLVASGISGRNPMVDYLFPPKLALPHIESQLKIICEEKFKDELQAIPDETERSLLLEAKYADMLDDCGYSNIIYDVLCSSVFTGFEQLLEEQEKSTQSLLDEWNEQRVEIHDIIKKLNSQFTNEKGEHLLRQPLTLETFKSLDNVKAILLENFGVKAKMKLCRDRLTLHLSLFVAEDDPDDLDYEDRKVYIKSTSILRVEDLLIGLVSKSGEQALVQKSKGHWQVATVTAVQHFVISEECEMNCVRAEHLQYCVQLCCNDTPLDTAFTHRSLANASSDWDARVVCPVGTLVVAPFQLDHNHRELRIGLVVEPPSHVNRCRYLVFYEMGRVRYCHPKNVFRVFAQNYNNWREMRPETHNFLKSYLAKYPERTMVRLRPNQLVATAMSTNGYFSGALVLRVDCSMVLVQFPDNTQEWLYRGSPQFQPIYHTLYPDAAGTLLKTLAFVGRARAHTGGVGRMMSGPVLEFVKGDLDMDEAEMAAVKEKADSGKTSRSTARKSTAPGYSRPAPAAATPLSPPSTRPLGRPPKRPPFLQNQVAVPSRQAIGSFVNALNLHLEHKPLPNFTPHECSSRCLAWRHPNGHIGINDDPQPWRGKFSPLAIPLLLGWRRSKMEVSLPLAGVVDPAEREYQIQYLTPCGRSLRKASEVNRFLRVTKSRLSIDFFTFDPEISVAREFKPGGLLVCVEDYASGREDIPLSCVNSVDHEAPPDLDYHRTRFTRNPQVAAVLDNLDYCVCCSCTDGCANPLKCECRRLTAEGTALVDVEHSVTRSASYNNRRLHRQLVGGLYECNARCACQPRQCSNRVVQLGIWNKLQIYKTDKKGWGIRTLHDIPKGTFLCVYAGEIFNESRAVESGNLYGDEYQADLDFIESVEAPKEGYEENVVPPEDPLDTESSGVEVTKKVNSDSEIEGTSETDTALPVKRARLELASPEPDVKEGEVSTTITNDIVESATTETNTDEDGLKEDQLSIATESNSGEGEPTIVQLVGSKSSAPPPSSRVYLNEEDPYVMDAKFSGNVGRYFNHCCDPNVFVQNVFVSSHDPRLPEIAFFTLRSIKAGEELTWDYRYEPDSVPNRTLLCHCGAPNCRRRLL